VATEKPRLRIQLDASSNDGFLVRSAARQASYASFRAYASYTCGLRNYNRASNDHSSGIGIRIAKTRMDDWFNVIAANCVLSTAAVQDLHDVGFVIVPGPIRPEGLGQLSEAYDSAVASALASADSDDGKIGTSTIRVHDFVNRGPEFDGLYVFPPVLEACCRIIHQPFKLGSMLARTLRPRSPAQDLHVDFKCDSNGWPMVGFILMLDEFRCDNGATRFVPGSHKTLKSPNEVMKDTTAAYEGQVLGCGPAGSLIIYNGSTWHGHTANQTVEPRRSIQGAFVRREAQAHLNQRSRIRPETLGRIGGLAKYILDVETNNGEQAC
jgi:hypothetical protein